MPLMLTGAPQPVLMVLTEVVGAHARQHLPVIGQRQLILHEDPGSTNHIALMGGTGEHAGCSTVHRFVDVDGEGLVGDGGLVDLLYGGQPPGLHPGQQRVSDAGRLEVPRNLGLQRGVTRGQRTPAATPGQRAVVGA